MFVRNNSPKKNSPIRITTKSHPKHILESNFFDGEGRFKINKSDTGCIFFGKEVHYKCLKQLEQKALKKDDPKRQKKDKKKHRAKRIYAMAFQRVSFAFLE